MYRKKGMISINVEISPKIKKDGRSSLRLRFTQEKKHLRKSLGIDVESKHFNPDAKFGFWIRRSCPLYKEFNSQIKSAIEKYTIAGAELKKFDDNYTINQLIQRADFGEKDFVTYAKEESKRYLDINKIDTHRQLNSLILNLEMFLKGEPLYFNRLNISFLKKFEVFLSKKNRPNTVVAYFSKIKTLLNNAIKEDLFPIYKNPFFHFKVKGAAVEKERLSTYEIGLIEKFQPVYHSTAWHTKNMFLFSYYTAGMRFFDVVTLKKKNIKVIVLDYIASKSKTRISFTLCKKAIEILELYDLKTKSNNDYIFPFIKRGVDDIDLETLKKKVSSIAAMATGRLKMVIKRYTGIKKHFSFHTARHSYANNTMKKTNDLDKVSKSLGHSDIETTKIYLESFKDEELDKFLKDVYEDDEEPPKE